MRTTCLLLLLVWVNAAFADPKPVPSSPYIQIIYRYADAMLKNGRDVAGPEKTGLFLSSLDRKALEPLKERPAADPNLDQNLLRLLYTLSELSSKPIYRQAADAHLKWHLEHIGPEARLAPWDEGVAWDVLKDKPVPADPDSHPRPWMLWERCFTLSPQTSKRLVLGLRAVPAKNLRRGGYSIRAFAVAYQQTRDDDFLKAIEATLKEMDAIRNSRGDAMLGAAIDCAGAASQLPQPLASRLREFASVQDQAFCSLAHDIKNKSGFALDDSVTSLWKPGRQGITTASIAMMCVARYENTSDIRYRDLIRAAADAYAADPPADGAEGVDPWPMTFGNAISLQLAAWRDTSRQQHLDRAIKLADAALQRYWSDTVIPRESPALQNYSNATGLDTLALSMVELHLSILHITAVRCPSNTIDR
jgi:hypothetical protein